MPLEKLDALERAAKKALDTKAASERLFTYYPDDGPLRRELYPKHVEFFRAGKVHRERAVMAGNRTGKALKHGTKVATPTGWAAIEDLSVGDVVIAGNGNPTRVVGVYPQGEVDLFSLSFDGTREVVACGEHRWTYLPPAARFPTRYDRNGVMSNPRFGKWEVGSTRDLMRYVGKNPKQRVVVPLSEPFSLNGERPKLDPYVVGLLLGDGGLTGDTVKFSSADPELVDAVSGAFSVTHYGGYDYGVRGAVTEMKRLGVWGLRSDKKHVPRAYLFADFESRLSILQGLMDTDGSISAVSKHMEFSTTSDRLAEDFEWLAVSLGMKVRRERRQTSCNGKQGLKSWRMNLRSARLCPFRLRRKAARWAPLKETRNWILHDIQQVERGEATCIEVEDDSHTFVIEGGVVTHNTEGIGGFEVALHLTGMYDRFPWWPGHKFEKPTNWLCGGDTSTTTRDILVKKMLGPPEARGTGMIPKANIIEMRPYAGIPGHIDYARIAHEGGGESILQFRSYDQGREAWQGTERDGVWMDEEPPMDVYVESLMRTMTTKGLVICTFTPLRGLTDVALSFMPEMVA